MKFKIFYESTQAVEYINEFMGILENDINGIIAQCKTFISHATKNIHQPDFDWTIINRISIALYDISYQFYEVYPQSLKINTAKKTIEKLSKLQDNIQEIIHNLPDQNIITHLTEILSMLSITITNIKDYVKI